MKDGAAFTVANEARPGNVFVFNRLLPEVLRRDYVARAGAMTVRATMAGLVGMDSPYPEGGSFDISTFEEDTVKIANRVRLPEKSLRDLYEFIRTVRDGGGNSTEAVIDEALNFVDKLIVQPHLDTMEWLRGQALVTGAIDWVFNKKRLLVDYGVPSTNFLPARTGTAGYGGNASLFWADIRAIRRILKNNIRAFIWHSETREMVLANDANSIAIVNENGSQIEIVKIVGNTERNSTDARDRARFIAYDEEGEIFDPVNEGKTISIPFMPKGAILAVGNNNAAQFVIGAGSTPPPNNTLGFTHIGPTVEGRNAPGRWADVYTPQNEPWAIEGRGVTNGLPVIEAPEKIAVATTEMV